MKAVVADFNKEKALVGAFSVITNLRMELFEALVVTVFTTSDCPDSRPGALHHLHTLQIISTGNSTLTILHTMKTVDMIVAHRLIWSLYKCANHFHEFQSDIRS